VPHQANINGGVECDYLDQSALPQAKCTCKTEAALPSPNFDVPSYNPLHRGHHGLSDTGVYSTKCTIHIISYLKGKILTMKPPGHPGTVSNRDSILEAAKLSDRL